MPQAASTASVVPQMQPLGNAIDKQVDNLEFRQVAPGKTPRIRPTAAVISLTAVRLNRLLPSASANSASMRVDSPRAYISTASASSSAARPRTISPIAERNGSARSAICGALYSILPSRCPAAPSDSRCGNRRRAPPRA